ncbi:MAG: alpha/beta hydrolase [Ilumatobacteraceae bacterium]|nr:alpha/beta hydrolase [Ilumatobacteraceae bacterium]
MPFMSPISDVMGRRLAWREAGPSNARATVVLLHGLGGSRISWEPQLAGLSDEYRVVAWDMPGYGESAPLEGTMTFDALADAVADAVDSLVVELGDGRVHLVGISFGGMIAQYAAARHPGAVQTLTLLSTSAKFGLDGTGPDQWRAARLAPLDLGLEPVDFAERVLGGLAGPHITTEAFNGQVAAMARITGAALRRSIDCLITHDSRSLLPSIVAPTLCMVGELDDETPPAYAMGVADLVPHARLVMIEGAGHLLNVEAPDAVNDAIVDHIARAGALSDRSTP